MQSSPSCWPGKGLEKMVFSPYFSNPHGRPSRIPWGRTPWKGQDVPQELCQSRVLARSWGRPGCPVQPKAPALCPASRARGSAVLRSRARPHRPGSKGRGASVLERAASQRRLCGHRSGTACSPPGSNAARSNRSLSGETRTSCEVIRIFLNAVW